jgi:hypothetical protein
VSWSLASALALSAGCVADTSAKETAKPPEWVRPTNLVITSEQPEDRNSDGYDDTIFVTIYVFDMDYRAQSIRVDGSYEFMLVDSDGKFSMKWDVPSEIVSSAYRREAPGPMVRLRLTIPPERASKLGGRAYTLQARLTDAEGRMLESSGASFTLRQKGR